jgi:hypothetical protein
MAQVDGHTDSTGKEHAELGGRVSWRAVRAFFSAPATID